MIEEAERATHFVNSGKYICKLMVCHVGSKPLTDTDLVSPWKGMPVTASFSLSERPRGQCIR